MIINPIIPVWLMGIVCVLFLLMKRRNKFAFIRQIVMVILLFLINLRIMVGNSSVETVAIGADVLFVVDNTISMQAEDYDGNGRRMDAVREDCAYIMEQLAGASFSVMSFGNHVQTLIPYTMDKSNAMQALGSLKGQAALYAEGTSFNAVLKELGEVLNRDKDNKQIVFFISDGEITREEQLKSFDELHKYVDAGAVLGYGTTEGGPMQAADFSGSDEELEYLTYYDDNYDEQIAMSVIDEQNLEAIASDLGVAYIHMDKQERIDKELAKIRDDMLATAMTKQKMSTDGYADIYHYFVIPLVLLLVYDFIDIRRKTGGTMLR